MELHFKDNSNMFFEIAQMKKKIDTNNEDNLRLTYHKISTDSNYAFWFFMKNYTMKSQI